MYVPATHKAVSLNLHRYNTASSKVGAEYKLHLADS
jgi:hypothetical protein